MNRSMRSPLRARRGFVRANEIFPFVVIVACLAFAIYYQKTRLEGVKQKWDRYYQTMKLPPTEMLKLVTLGYDNVYADWLWLQSIQAFGKGWITDTMQKRIDLEAEMEAKGAELSESEKADYQEQLDDLRERQTEPIFQYFDTLTDVDPHFVASYRFGNLIIGDNRLDWKRAQLLLRKGSYKNPMEYNIPYLGLYNAIWMYDGDVDAKWFARRLGRIPDAPNFMKRLESFIEQKSERFDVAFEYNIRYLIEYMARDNDLEIPLVKNRIRTLLDQWNRNEMDKAVGRYLEKYKEHPHTIEDILEPGIRPEFEAPLFPAIEAALQINIDDIDRLDPSEQVPQELIDRIVKQSTRPIRGLPQDPSGYWYVIQPELRRLFIQEGTKPNESDFPYVVSVKDLIPMIDSQLVQGQRFIMDFYEENDRTPTQEEMSGFLTRDLLGGHFVYEPEAPESPKYGVFYSTATRRMLDDPNGEPRKNMFGPGPFPFPIMPRLQDRPDERKWGLEHGYILPDGTEIFTLPEEEKTEEASLPENTDETPPTGEP